MKDSKKVILTCSICLSRNYSLSKSKSKVDRLQLKKYCPRCNQYTLHKETKQEVIMKWFNLSAIFKELSKIRWPKKEDLFSNSIQVLIFVGFFVVFFAICLVAISALLNVLGVL